MKKVAVIGSGGAGKSTFSRQLSERTGISVYHLDALFWKPNWVMTPKEEQREMQRQLIREESWIIDGNYGGTMEVRLQAADTVIFLDMPRTLCLYRAFKRMLKYWNRTRPDMGADCKERFDAEFYKWIWQFPKNQRPLLYKQLKQLPEEKTVIILSSRKQVKDFIENQ